MLSTVVLSRLSARMCCSRSGNWPKVVSVPLNLRVCQHYVARHQGYSTHPCINTINTRSVGVGATVASVGFAADDETSGDCMMAVQHHRGRVSARGCTTGRRCEPGDALRKRNEAGIAIFGLGGLHM